MSLKTTAAVAALCAFGLLAGCNQQQASAPAPAPAAEPAAVPPATEQTSLTPNQGPPAAADTSPAANKKFL